MVKLSQIMPLAAAVALSACSAAEERVVQAPKADPVPTAAQAAELRKQVVAWSDANVAKGEDLMAKAKAASLDGKARIFKQEDGSVVINSRPLEVSGNKAFNQYEIERFMTRVFDDAVRDDRQFNRGTPVADLKIRPHSMDNYMHVQQRLEGGVNIHPAEKQIVSIVNFEANRVCTDGVDGQDCYDIEDISPSSPLARDVAIAQAKYRTAVNYDLNM